MMSQTGSAASTPPSCPSWRSVRGRIVTSAILTYFGQIVTQSRVLTKRSCRRHLPGASLRRLRNPASMVPAEHTGLDLRGKTAGKLRIRRQAAGGNAMALPFDQRDLGMAQLF